MFRLAQIRRIAPPLIIMIALAGVLVAMIATKPEPPARVAPAPIDTSVPRGLSTATFGMG